MRAPHTIDRVGTGTIKTPRIGLLLASQHAVHTNRMTSQTTRLLLKDPDNIQSLNCPHEKRVVDAEKSPMLKERQRQRVHSKRHTCEGAGHRCHTGSLAVLAITHNPELMSLVETVCMAHGIQVTTAVYRREDEDFNLGVTLSAYGLIVVDLEVFGDCQWRQNHLGCRWLRTLTETYPSLPLLFIGTVSQKHAILAIRADTVQFLTRPITWHDLAHVVDDCDRAWKHGVQTGGEI